MSSSVKREADERFNHERDDRSGGNHNRGVKREPDERGGAYVKPDYGNSFIPGAGPDHLAPKSLDHFKRGYEERTAHRDKELYMMRQEGMGRDRDRGGGGNRHRSNDWEGDGVGGGGGGRSRHDNRNNGGDGPRRHSEDTPWHSGIRDHHRPTILQGLDIQNLVDRLSSKLSSPNDLFAELDRSRQAYRSVFESGKAMTALISVAARRKNIGLGHALWDWMDHAGLPKNTFHYNSMISVTEKARDYQKALSLLKEMRERNIPKNEVTFSSAISACEKCGQWQKAIDLLNSMSDEGVTRTAIAYNAAISACEKGMVPQKACEVFQRMKRDGVDPSVVSYSALISAAEKGGQWKLALEILEEMKREGFHGNVVAYSAAISALAKGQQWRKALFLFREIQSHGGTPSIVTYNATMTALEKGMEWERALDLFEEMKVNNLPITVVSYGSAISACDKGFQYRQCLEFLDEMTEMGIPKNVIIFGAAMSCIEKCSRADIGFQLMKRMKEEGIAPNVHIYNSAISACARSNLWERGYELYKEMDEVGVKRDVVTYNAVLDAVSTQIQLGRKLFEVGVERGFYAKVSRLGEVWFELDLHFLSLGGGEIALGWWFEECLVPYLTDTERLSTVKSISIVTGYGKTRTRGRRHGDDGMRKRCRAMLQFMGIAEHEQPNLGRIHIDKESLIEIVKKNGGRVIFDLEGYTQWKDNETTANANPIAEQKIRARFKPTNAGSGRPPFTRVESEYTSEEYRADNELKRLAQLRERDALDNAEYRADIDYAVRDNIRFDDFTETSRPSRNDVGRNNLGGKRNHAGDRDGRYDASGVVGRSDEVGRGGSDRPYHDSRSGGDRPYEQRHRISDSDGRFDRKTGGPEHRSNQDTRYGSHNENPRMDRNTEYRGNNHGGHGSNRDGSLVDDRRGRVNMGGSHSHYGNQTKQGEDAAMGRYGNNEHDDLQGRNGDNARYDRSSGPTEGGRNGYHDNRKFDGHALERDATSRDGATDRKRQFHSHDSVDAAAALSSSIDHHASAEVLNLPGDGTSNEAERRASNSSRGYSLEPLTQRRRLS